ncbi:hypothetical protein ABT095_19720 [Kitasatospora sp. NPDC002227]|uniref:alpha/beta hydrolase family protein n=1 Tax=Kitasatospora sp. NPDC002227 TaxID=3154773 RepID=UPI0033235AD5
MTTATGHRRRLTLGRIPFTACRADPRFSYCRYVPERATARSPLLVVVHGDRRTAEQYRNALEHFAEAHGCIVLAPLFPVGVPRQGDPFTYKRLSGGGLRFDLVLLRMVEEAAARAGRFYLHGFSGGGQFALRFHSLHPERLAGLSVGAPGRITLPDPTLPWPAGTADAAERFGLTPSLEAARAVPVHLTVGELDTRRPARPPQLSRVEQTTGLYHRLRALGVPATLEIVPGLGHDGFALLPAATGFLGGLMGAG